LPIQFNHSPEGIDNLLEQLTGICIASRDIARGMPHLSCKEQPFYNILQEPWKLKRKTKKQLQQ
jgi:hypothetical protein